MGKSPVIFVDLDDVLVDFTSAACQIHGFNPEVVREKQRGEWGINTVMGLTLDEFWEPIHNYVWGENKFWEGLELLPWAIDLIKVVEKACTRRGCQWLILSSPSSTAECHLGKVKWLKNHFGKDFSKFIITGRKELLAGPARLLIDDREKNCQSFTAAGGESFVFPQYGNAFYNEREQAIYKLERFLVSWL